MIPAHVPEQEPDLLPMRRILRVLLATFGVLALAVVCSWWMQTTAPATQHGAAAQSRLAGPLGLEVTPIEQQARGLNLRAQQRKQLANYAWVNRDAGVVRIPIERALDLRAEEAR
jgi:hypothetical protein